MFPLSVKLSWNIYCKWPSIFFMAIFSNCALPLYHNTHYSPFTSHVGVRSIWLTFFLRFQTYLNDRHRLSAPPTLDFPPILLNSDHCFHLHLTPLFQTADQPFLHVTLVCFGWLVWSLEGMVLEKWKLSPTELLSGKEKNKTKQDI